MHYFIQYHLPANAERDKHLTEVLGELICSSQFLAEEGVAELKVRFSGVEIIDKIPIDDERLRDKWWFGFVNNHQEIYSTKEINEILNKGEEVEMLSGPYNTYNDASYHLDLFWETPGDDD
jgi:hypothetical protein